MHAPQTPSPQHILKLLQQDKSGPKSMIIRVTDEELLSKTGGIVQGMSEYICPCDMN